MEAAALLYSYGDISPYDVTQPETGVIAEYDLAIFITITVIGMTLLGMVLTVRSLAALLVFPLRFKLHGLASPPDLPPIFLRAWPMPLTSHTPVTYRRPSRTTYSTY